LVLHKIPSRYTVATLGILTWNTGRYFMKYPEGSQKVHKTWNQCLGEGFLATSQFGGEIRREQVHEEGDKCGVGLL
jgi:hypothetical protein